MEKIKIKVDLLELVSVSSIKPNPANRNKHPEKQIDRLADIYKYQGMRVPIIVSKQSGFIVAGHGRLEAAKKSGLLEVPVSYQDFDSPEQEYAFMVSDNAISLWAELDKAAINADLQELDPGFELDMLGLDGFKLDLSEIDKDHKEEIETDKLKTCPECGHQF